MAQSDRWSLRTVGIEVVIVVAGILIAFALNSWWEGRSRRANERAHLRALHGDFLQNAAELDQLIELQEGIVSASNTLLDLAQQRNVAQDTAYRLLAAVFTSNRFNPAMGAYQGILHSGGLAQIRDDSLRASLVRFSSMLESRYVEQFSTEMYLSFVREYIGNLFFGRKTFDVSVLQDARFQEFIGLRALTERDVGRSYRELRHQAAAILGRLEALSN